MHGTLQLVCKMIAGLFLIGGTAFDWWVELVERKIQHSSQHGTQHQFDADFTSMKTAKTSEV